MRKVDFQAFGETIKFKNSFVFKGFSEDFAHYLPMKLNVVGPDDGSCPSKVSIPL